MVWTPVTPRYDTITPRRELQFALRKNRARTEILGAVFESSANSSNADTRWDAKLQTPRVDAAAFMEVGVFEKEACTSVADVTWQSKLFTPRCPDACSQDVTTVGDTSEVESCEEPGTSPATPEAVPRLRMPTASEAYDGQGSLPVKRTPRPSIPVASLNQPPASEHTPNTVALEMQATLLASRVQELSQLLELEAREREAWERRALDAEATVSRLTADLEKRPHVTLDEDLRAQLAAARHSLDHARSEAAQARRDADMAWHQVGAARNDAELIQEVRLLAAAKDAGEGVAQGAARSSNCLAEEETMARAESADFRKLLSELLARGPTKPKAGGKLGGSLAGSLTADNSLLVEHLTNLQMHFSGTKQHAGMPVSQRVGELERRNLEMQRKLSKMSEFLDRFLCKAYHPLQQIHFVCRRLAKAFECSMPEGELLQALFDPDSDDTPMKLVNILSQLRFFALVLGTMTRKSQEQAGVCVF